MGAVDKNDQIAHLNKTRRHYCWLRRLFMKFLVWAAYNAYIIMDSYRPHSRAGHRFHTLHMFVDELCLQLVGDYRTAVHRREARAQQSDLLRLQGVGQHHPKRSPAATGNNLCVVCCAKYNKYLKKHPATAYGNMLTRTTPNFTTSWVGGRQRARAPVAGEFHSHHSRCGPGYLPGRLLITLDPALSPLSLAVACVFCNKFLNFFNFLSVFLATYRLLWPLELV